MLFYELHQANKLAVSQMQLGIVQGATDWYDGENPPLAHSCIAEQIINILQFVDIPLIDARHHIEIDGGGGSACKMLGGLKIDDSIIPVFDEKRHIASEKHFIVTMWWNKFKFQFDKKTRASGLPKALFFVWSEA